MIKAPGNAEESGKGEDAEGGELGQVLVPRIRTVDGLERVGKRSNSVFAPPLNLRLDLSLGDPWRHEVRAVVGNDKVSFPLHCRHTPTPDRDSRQTSH